LIKSPLLNNGYAGKRPLMSKESNIRLISASRSEASIWNSKRLSSSGTILFSFFFFSTAAISLLRTSSTAGVTPLFWAMNYLTKEAAEIAEIAVESY